jgi:hypothetical protein
MGEVVEMPNRKPAAAGESPPGPGATEAIGMALQRAWEYTRIAAGRLTELPPPGSIPKERLDGLLATYTTLNANLSDIKARLDAGLDQQGPDKGLDVQRDFDEVQKQVQGFVQAVESTLNEVGIPTPREVPGSSGVQGIVRLQGTDTPSKVNWPLVGALAAAVGLAGIAFWQMRKAQKPGPLPARGRGRSKR